MQTSHRAVWKITPKAFQAPKWSIGYENEGSKELKSDLANDPNLQIKCRQVELGALEILAFVH